MELSAHEKAMMRRANFVESNRYAVSPGERDALLQWKHDQGLTRRERAMQDFERGMQGDRIAGDIEVAEAKRDGMIGQGRDAANANGQWGLKIEQERGKNALSLEERKWAGQRGLEETRGKNALDVVTQQGKDSLLTEKERQGGALNVEKQKGRNALDVEQERGDTSLELAQRQQETEATRARIEALRQNGKDAVERQKIISQQILALQKDPANRTLTDEQLRAKALKLLGLDGNGGNSLANFAE